MLDSYRGVTACGQPNCSGARLPLSSNFNFHEYKAIAHTQVDHEVLQYLQYGFPAGLEGPTRTPSFGNNSSAINHPRDVKAYITTELGPLSSTPLRPLVPDQPSPQQSQMKLN